MLSFITFNWQNDEHKKLAAQENKDAVPILFFTDEDAVVRRGFLFTKYDDHDVGRYCDEYWIRYESYCEVTKTCYNIEVAAEGTYIMPIKIVGMWS